MNTFVLKNFIESLSENDFIKQCGLPLGYRIYYPIIKEKAGKVLLVIPFYKLQKSKTPGVSVIFPITYTVTFELLSIGSIPESYKKYSDKTGFCGAKPIGFETLKYTKEFNKIDFGKPIEVFPHKELKKIGEEEYHKKSERAYAYYDAVINDLLGIEKAAGIDKLEFKRTLNLLVGPTTKLIYKILDENFYDKYLNV